MVGLISIVKGGENPCLFANSSLNEELVRSPLMKRFFATVFRQCGESSVITRRNILVAWPFSPSRKLSSTALTAAFAFAPQTSRDAKALSM